MIELSLCQSMHFSTPTVRSGIRSRNCIKLCALQSFFTPLIFLTICYENGNSAASDSDIESDSVAELLVEDLPVDAKCIGIFTYFSFHNNAIVTGANAQADQWDLAFKSASILIDLGDSKLDRSSGLLLSGVDCDDLSELPVSGWQINANGLPTTARGGWHTYGGGESHPPHKTLTNPGIGPDAYTADGHCAKYRS